MINLGRAIVTKRGGRYSDETAMPLTESDPSNSLTPAVVIPGKTVLAGLHEVNAVIARKVEAKMAAGRSEWATYDAALRAVALEEPDLFLTLARLQLDAEYRDQSIYFDFIDGQLVNPAVMQGGVLIPIPSPLDRTPLNPVIGPEEEMAIRIASKTIRVLASEGMRLPYVEAVRLVASENPNLMRRRNRAASR